MITLFKRVLGSSIRGETNVRHVLALKSQVTFQKKRFLYFGETSRYTFLPFDGRGLRGPEEAGHPGSSSAHQTRQTHTREVDSLSYPLAGPQQAHI
jgi:hypothetical protein